jgi:hypothetical protein
MAETPQKTGITVDLSNDAFAIMEKFRGKMPQGEFLDLVLRILDTDAVSSPPESMSKGASSKPNRSDH